MSYDAQRYKVSFTRDMDKLSVSKMQDGWCHIEMDVNGTVINEIVLRSKEHVEALHFMLGQLLHNGRDGQ